MCAGAKGGQPGQGGCEPSDGAAYVRGGELHVWISERLTDAEAKRARAAFVAVARKAGPHGGLQTR